MNNNYWLVYIIFYFVYELWVFTQLPLPYTFNITDFFYFIMLVGITGLALKRKLINKPLWRIIFWVSIIFLFHTWIIMPIIYLNNNIELEIIIRIQLFSVPSLPLFIGLFMYVWRSPIIWAKNIQQENQH